MMRNVAEDAAFKARSQKAALNRRGGNMDNPIQPSHCQGSVSTTVRAKKMAAQRGGILPTAAELYIDTHTRNVEGKGIVPVSDKAKRIKDAYEDNLAKSQESCANVDPNQVFYETVGGRQKGIIPGLGTSGDLYFDKTSRRSGSHATSSSPSIVAQLSQRLSEYIARDDYVATLERTQKEREDYIERLEKSTQEREAQLEQMQQMLNNYQDLLSRCNSAFPFPPPGDPRDPPSAGGSGAMAL